MIGAIEQRNISLAGYHDLDDRPAFKIGLQEVDERWYVYLGHFWHSGWSIVDVTDPKDPTLARFVSGPDNTHTGQVQVAEGLMLTSLERPRENWGPLGSPYDPEGPHETGAYLWSVEADPTDPDLLGHYETNGLGTHRNYYAGGDYAYLSACPEGFEPTRFDGKPESNRFPIIIDVSNPSDPVEVSRWMLPGQSPERDVEEREHNYYHGPAYVVGDRAHLSYGRAGIVTLDVSDEHDPELVYRMDFGDGLGAHNGVHSFIPVPDTDLAVVNSEAIREGSPLDEDGYPAQFVFVVDISDETDPGFERRSHHGPRVVSSIPLPMPEGHLPYDSYYEKDGRFGPHNQHHYRGEDCRFRTSDHLFLTYFNAGLRIFDISDPAIPKEAGYFVPEDPTERIGVRRPRSGLSAHFEDVVVDSRGYIYCTDSQRGLFVLESDLL